MGGGLTDWHRQKRKKEQKKNKEKRLAERDARVLETKTAASVQDEIRKLERQHKVKKDDDGQEIPLPHNIKSKLDRLKKELKLLKEAEGEQKDKKSTSTKDAAGASKWKPLDNPQLSIYYDPVMNPYGEPPPGQPRLYHTADGRTTFNLAEAALPGSRPPPPPPPRKDPPPRQSAQNQSPPNHRTSQQQQQRQRQRAAPSNREQPAPEKRDFRQKGNDERKKDVSPPAPREAQKATSASAGTKKAAEAPAAPPDLPSPSQAVKRGRSRLKADIWASTEEIDYPQHAHSDTTDEATPLNLEGVEVGGKAKGEVPIKEWWYEDNQKQIQGPFPHEQMVAWIRAGYFPAETRARPRPDAPWKPFHHYSVIRAVLKGDDKAQEAQPKQEMSVQERIASLRKEHQETSIADRIAALRGDGPKPENNAAPDEDDHDQHEGENEDVFPPPPPPPPDAGADEVPAYPAVEFDDADGVAHAGDLPPPPPPPPPGGEIFEQAAYAIDEMEDDALPPPPPPEPAYSDEPVEIPAYGLEDVPADEGNEDHPLAYPTDEYAGDVTYPVDDAPVTDAYPVMDTYPRVDSGDRDGQPPAKKKAKVDRDVIAFRPTHLQKRKK